MPCEGVWQIHSVLDNFKGKTAGILNILMKGTTWQKKYIEFQSVRFVVILLEQEFFQSLNVGQTAPSAGS